MKQVFSIKSVFVILIQLQTLSIFIFFTDVLASARFLLVPSIFGITFKTCQREKHMK